MPMTLADVGLTLDDKDGNFADFIKKHINPELYRPWLRRAFPGAGYTSLAWPTGFAPDTPFKLNSFFWPAWGASRWAFGHFLADAERVNVIRKAAFGDDGDEQNKIEFFMSTPNASSDESLKTKVYLLPPTPLSSVPVDSKFHQVNNLFLLTIVDARYYWWYKATPEVKLNDDSTWQSAFDIAKDALDIDLTVDSINSLYLNPSPQLNLSYEVIPPWLDALCSNVGHRLLAMLDGTYVSQRYFAALQDRNRDVRDHPNRQIMAGGVRFQDIIF